MNTDNRMDERWLQQVDDRLENGKVSDYAIINVLAETLSSAEHVPQADRAFRDDLEAKLIVHLQHRQLQKERTLMAPTKLSTPFHFYSSMTWAAALIVIVLMGSYALMQRSQPVLPAMQAATTEPMYTIVIATRNIEAATTITDDMVGVINLSALDYQKLQNGAPQRKFFSTIKDVVGQTTTTAIFWFEPIEPIKVGQTENCPRTDVACVEKPAGTYIISLPLPMTVIADMGLTAGDRVDVLTSVDNQLKVAVEDVMLTNIQNDKLTFAASAWKLSVMIWLGRTEQAYTLRLHRGEAPARSDERVDFSFTSPEALPDNYKFHLVAELPDSKGYQLVGAPYSLDSIQFTQSDTIMNFWFTNLTVVSITDKTKVIINLPKSDAANLDFLLKKGANLTFIPQ